MSIYLNKLKVKNFRSFPSNYFKEFNIVGNNVVILDGPNGYGKSTVFDSIELLITGKLKHFKATLKNGHATPLSIIANDPKEMTEIVGEFVSKDKQFSIIRTFIWNKSNTSQIYYSENGIDREEIEEEQLYTLLNINYNYFDVGMYISQTDSLQFLQEKYLKRKEILTSILDIDEITNKISFIKEIKKNYTKEHKAIEDKLTGKKNVLISQKRDIDKTIQKINTQDQLISFTKLFPNKDYLFDVEQVDTSIEIETLTKDLISIKEFIRDFEKYLDSKKKNELDKLISLSKLSLKKFFYREKETQFEEKRDYWNELAEIQICLNEKKLMKSLASYSLVKDSQEILDLFDKYFEEETQKSNLEEEIKEEKSEIRTLNRKRAELYQQHEDQDLIDHNCCPFCGTLLPDLDKTYEEITKKFEHLMSNNQIEISKLEKTIDKIKHQILDKLDSGLSKDKKDLELYLEFKDIERISEEVIRSLNSNIEDFSQQFRQTSEEAPTFEDQYDQLVLALKNKRGSKAIYSEEKIIRYDNIFSEAFDKHKPQITIQEVENKENYIQNKYLNKYIMKQQSIERSLRKNEKFSETLKNKSERYVDLLDVLLNCNNSALKQYQNLFVKKIRIPLYLLSGRIIQNYQLGLGVDVEVNDTQVYFKVSDKDTDIFNILSMGQLNGVILALLLSIRKVYSKEDQLDLILIDDPLQSIDELSAHSFTDLLAEEFSDTQLVLSTHEEDKSRLIQYKYKQLGKKAKNYNMQLEYLRS